MKTRARTTARLGDVVVAIYDEAARYSTDPQEVSRLATQAVARVLRLALRTSIADRVATPDDVRLMRTLRPAPRVTHGYC